MRKATVPAAKQTALILTGALGKIHKINDYK
jgi:hypothetical protein